MKVRKISYCSINTQTPNYMKNKYIKIMKSFKPLMIQKDFNIGLYIKGVLFAIYINMSLFLDRSLVFEQESISFMNDMDQILRFKFTAKTVNDLKNPEGMNLCIF